MSKAMRKQKYSSMRGKEGAARPLWEQATKYMKNSNRRSFRTRDTHLDKLSPFIDHVAERYGLQKIENIHDKHILSFIEESYSKGLAVSTIWNTVSAVQFLSKEFPENRAHISETERIKEKFVQMQKEKNENFTKKDVQRTYLDNGKNVAWTKDEINKAIDYAVSTERYDIAIKLTFGAEFGTRIHEMARQDLSHINQSLRTGKLETKGKGGYIRDIPVTNEKQLDILKIAKNMASEDHQKPFIREGKTIEQEIKSIQNWIYNHRVKFVDEPDRKLTYHGLRTTYAQKEFSRVYEKTGDLKSTLRQVSEQLGHHREWITRVYLSKDE